MFYPVLQEFRAPKTRPPCWKTTAFGRDLSVWWATSGQLEQIFLCCGGVRCGAPHTLVKSAEEKADSASLAQWSNMIMTDHSDESWIIMNHERSSPGTSGIIRTFPNSQFPSLVSPLDSGNQTRHFAGHSLPSPSTGPWLCFSKVP